MKRIRSFEWVCLAVLLSAGTLLSCGGGGGGGGAAGPQLDYVTARFPVNGANWNDYVQGASPATATDTLCSATTDTACQHGGELRKVVVTGKSSCANLTATDALGAFDWTCDASTGTARFTSTGLKNGKYLSDLLDFTAAGWKANSVTVADNGTAYLTTASTAWWTNPITASNSGNNGAAMTAGGVYIIQSNPTSTYTIGANKVALVVKPGVLVTGSTTTGEKLISATGRDFIWFEGSLDAAGDTAGVFWTNVRFSSLRNVSVINADTSPYQMGLWLQAISYNRIRDIETKDTLDGGFVLYLSDHNDIRNVSCVKDAWLAQIRIESSNFNYLENITAMHSRQKGIDIYNSSNNTFVNLMANNNHTHGITLQNGSTGNAVFNAIVANNPGNGIGISSASLDNVLANVTIVNGENNGMTLSGVTNNVLLNSLAVNNLGWGYFLSLASDKNLFVNTATANQGDGIYLDSVSNTTFSGLLKIGTLSTTCSVISGTNPGLDNTTCANNGSSNATLTTGVTASASFVGKVLTTDISNASNTTGAAEFQNITDWLKFSNTYRFWGREGTAAFPHSSNTGYCGEGGATENCRIYDWSLALGDTGDSGSPALLGVLSMPTGTMFFAHTLSTGATVTALMNAVEFLDGTGNGNGNGLCESGETCLYTPNIGAYQGHGALVSAGTITTGTITGVTLMKYEFNGR